MYLSLYGSHLVVLRFGYLNRTLSASYDDILSVEGYNWVNQTGSRTTRSVAET